MKTAALALAATFTFAAPMAGAAATAEEHVGINAEKGDPMRWRIPADTPRLKYEAEAKGIRASLAESLNECRALGAGRPACDAQAQSQYRADLQTARGLLAQDRQATPAPGAPR